MESGQYIPKVLYKYMTLDRFKKSMKQYLTGQAWFTDLEYVNDPFEGIPKESYLKDLETTSFYERLEKTRICSLSENNDNELLWAHYADSHKGVCIGFRVDPAILGKEKIELGKIRYENIHNPSLFNPLISAIEILKNRQDVVCATRDSVFKQLVPIYEGLKQVSPIYEGLCNNFAASSDEEAMVWMLIKLVLFRKRMAWKYEQEWRLLMPSGKQGFQKIGTVKEIRFGTNCTDLDVEIMKSPYWDSNIKIYKAKLDTDQEKVIFQEWDPSIQNLQTFLATKPVPQQTSTVKYGVTKKAELEGMYFFSLGNKDYSEGNYTRAITNFTESLRLNANFTLALMARGGAYYHMGDFEKAVIDFSKVVMLEPHNALAKTTLEKATAALNNTPRNAEYFFNSGNVYCEKGDYQQAIMDWNMAIEIKPDYAAAFYNRGLTYLQYLDNFNQAIDDFTESIRLNPYDAKAYYQRGTAYGLKSDNNQAIVDFTEAIRLKPDYTDAYANRGTVYYTNANYDKAIADYTEVLRLDPNNAKYKDYLNEAKKLLNKIVNCHT